MNGKQKCKILKQIRAQIAEANDISLVVNECTHKGECRGTCPRCEAEVRYLEEEMAKRRSLGKQIALAGVSIGVTVALSGCSAVETMVDAVHDWFDRPPAIIDLMGDVPNDVQGEVEVIEGEVAPYFDEESGETAASGN